MGPGPDGPMGAMGAMEPHHMNGSLGGFKKSFADPSTTWAAIYFGFTLKNNLLFPSFPFLRVWGYGWVAKGEGNSNFQ